MTFKQRRIYVDATSWRLYNVSLMSMQRRSIDINVTLYKRHMPVEFTHIIYFTAGFPKWSFLVLILDTPIITNRDNANILTRMREKWKHLMWFLFKYWKCAENVRKIIWWHFHHYVPGQFISFGFLYLPKIFKHLNSISMPILKWDHVLSSNYCCFFKLW